MNNRILVFSKNIFYVLGGAELSLYHAAEDRACNGDHITVCGVEQNKAFGRRLSKNDIYNPGFKLDRLSIKGSRLFSRFSFTEYRINKGNLIRYFGGMSPDTYDELWAQNLWAPAAILGFTGRSVMFCRDEFFLNEYNIYDPGVRGIIKKFYRFVEKPGFSQYCRDNLRAIQKAEDIISNSYYMADRIKKRFNRDSQVVLPFIDRSKLRQEYQDGFQIEDSDKGVVFVGDNVLKGIDWVEALASELRGVKFYVFGRFNKRKVVANITYLPWQDRPADVYKYAKTVVVPSRWAEAYGRVAAESVALGIPCVVRNVGGLPEAVGYRSECIAEDYVEFKRKVLDFL